MWVIICGLQFRFMGIWDMKSWPGQLVLACLLVGGFWTIGVRFCFACFAFMMLEEQSFLISGLFPRDKEN
ncbi:hypothetical protein B0T17DRAFT_311691 [Bombardia bombarda]|uniref:Uncharacterized protein n=1 Tax=Bombardia bombarda TaxID=252184 RepID=A0AA39WLX2_9PEZI|nr:hypothetical protein B0T17DRAFT_311691 [Bombardia bombarda]